MEEEWKMARHMTDEGDGADDGVGGDVKTDDGDQRRNKK